MLSEQSPRQTQQCAHIATLWENLERTQSRALGTHIVCNVARLASARRLLLFHHDPNHSDDELEALCERVRELWKDGAVDLAREGEEIVFG